MAKNRRDIEDEILIDERLGDEEDYEEYARRRDAREGQRAIKSRIDEEEESRQNREYELRERRRAEASRRAQDDRRMKTYNRRKRKSHPVRNFFLALILIIFAAAAAFVFYMRSQLQTVNSVRLAESVENSISRQVREDKVMAGYQNIALFGVDSREQDLLGGDNRSDTIMICSINKRTGEIRRTRSAGPSRRSKCSIPTWTSISRIS